MFKKYFFDFFRKLFNEGSFHKHVWKKGVISVLNITWKSFIHLYVRKRIEHHFHVSFVQTFLFFLEIRKFCMYSYFLFVKYFHLVNVFIHFSRSSRDEIISDLFSVNLFKIFSSIFLIHMKWFFSTQVCIMN